MKTVHLEELDEKTSQELVARLHSELRSFRLSAVPVYDSVGGDSNLENLKQPDDSWKVRMIEEDFNRLMFDMERA